jgi:hypothetical protein
MLTVCVPQLTLTDSLQAADHKRMSATINPIKLVSGDTNRIRSYNATRHVTPFVICFLQIIFATSAFKLLSPAEKDSAHVLVFFLGLGIRIYV